MGEIGINKREYLYELSYCELLLIERGYSRRCCQMWSAIRWQTFNLMCVSMADLKKAGIYRPTDLIKFPWDNSELPEGGHLPTKEEVEEMRRIMMEENARAEANMG